MASMQNKHHPVSLGPVRRNIKAGEIASNED